MVEHATNSRVFSYRWNIYNGIVMHYKIDESLEIVELTDRILDTQRMSGMH